MKHFLKVLGINTVFALLFVLLVLVFEVQFTIALPIVLIPYSIIRFLFRRKDRKPKETTTLYQKERVIQKDSQADRFLTALLVSLWILGICLLFAGVFPFGFFLLAVAFAWTKKRIDRSKIENYQKIVLPSHWPKDCQYADYNQGLQNKTRFAGYSKDHSFYQRCVAEGISCIEGARNEQKAVLVAQAMKRKDLSVSALRNAFEAGKLFHEKNTAEAQDFAHAQELSAIRIRELDVLAAAMKYYGLRGREKRVAMLKDMYDEAKQSKKDAEYRQSLAKNTMLQKEHDWAVHGGIANGIAGPAAGLVAAMRVEAKNAAIREYNAQMAPYVQMLTSTYSGQANAHEKQMQQYQADIAKTKTKLLSNDSTGTVFEQLIIGNMTYAVSETGAVVVEADFSVSPDYRIFEEVSPAIDGVVAAQLIENGYHVGSAYFVFPVDGVHQKVRLASICTKTTNPHAKYTVKYAPVELWAIEKL